MNTLQNDFTGGITGRRISGRINTEIYANGCMELENFSIMPQGGITRRPSTRLVGTQLYGHRLVPFCVRQDMSFILEIGEGTIRIWHNGELFPIVYQGTEYTLITALQTGFALYTETEAEEIQYAQDYAHLYIAHRNHPPMVVTYSEVLVEGSMVPKLETSQLQPILQTDDTENEGLFEGRECPGVVFYYASRLWFAASLNHPYRLWASRPFQPENFEFWDIAEVMDEGATAQTMENAIKYGELSAESPTLEVTIDENTWKSVVTGSTVKTFSYNGTYWSLDGQQVNLATYGISYSGTAISGATITVRYYDIDEYSYTETEVVREDSALLLEVGSSRDESIMWMGSMGNDIIVGTASGEWLMPGSVDGLNQNIFQASAYGSSPVQPAAAGSDLMFLQTGSRKVRTYSGSSDGYSCRDLNFTSGEFGRITHMAWQRVPEQRLFCVMEDGTVMVLHYDRTTSLSGWSRWTFSGKRHSDGQTVESSVLDVCVIDTPQGQTVMVSIERDDVINLESFLEQDVDDTSPRIDCPSDDDWITCRARMTTTPYERTTDDGSSLGKRKRIYRCTARVINTEELSFGYRYTGGEPDPKYMESRSPAMENMGIADMEIQIPGGYERFVAFTAEKEDDGPATILALSLLTEVE